ncbi:MAG: N-acetyltransferase [Deltaproteobacteria bacterium]|nr:N-acetyltransferase [Deltaproteobacteria bacterium]
MTGNATRTTRIHPTAIVEPGVDVGPGTAIWDNVHIRGPAVVGRDCIIGEKTYVAYGVRIGDFVKVNAQVYICTGVTIEDQVMIAAGVIFTNDRYPRAFDQSGGLADSGPNQDTLVTTVGRGATIGAGARIGPGLAIGAYSMIGMGAVVVHDVPEHGLVYGNPARLHGYVCICGHPLPALAAVPAAEQLCQRCQTPYIVHRHGDTALPRFTTPRVAR